MVREELEAAGRYSRFVALMRWALPAAAVIMLLLLLVWPNPNGDVRSLPTTTMSQREMTNLRYSGLNAKGEPMVVTASRATQVGDMQQAIDLENVKGELTRANGGWVRLESAAGQYDQKNNKVVLTGQVHLTDNDGYDVTTEKAEISLENPAQAWGDQPVTGAGPQGNIRANGFRITDEGKTVMFTGRSRLVLPQGTR